MFHSENNDSPSRFSIGTGPVTNPDKNYILEASSSEKKQQWTKTIKELLNQQFEMLKGIIMHNIKCDLIWSYYIIVSVYCPIALKQPTRNRTSTVEYAPSFELVNDLACLFKNSLQ